MQFEEDTSKLTHGQEIEMYTRREMIFRARVCEISG